MPVAELERVHDRLQPLRTGAPGEIATRRQDGFFRLAELYKTRFARSREATREAASQISDLQFTQNYRVPFQYSRLVRENLGTELVKLGRFSEGMREYETAERLAPGDPRPFYLMGKAWLRQAG